MRIHILGPSGSGTSTLGEALSRCYQLPWFDSDTFFWEKTDPPFELKRPKEERIKLLEKMDAENASWVLSGSMIDWGDCLKPRFDLVIQLYVDQEERIRRLEKRERERFGERIDFGNDMYENHQDFIAWAKEYDEGDLNVRSIQSEAAWLADLTCPVLRIVNPPSLEEELRQVSAIIEQLIEELSSRGKI